MGWIERDRERGWKGLCLGVVRRERVGRSREARVKIRIFIGHDYPQSIFSGLYIYF